MFQIYSYTDFLTELHHLLSGAGIVPSRMPITAEAGNRKNKTGSEGEDSLSRQPQIGRVILYMNENLANPLNLEDLAAEIQISKYQLIREFRKEMDATPWQYLIEKRIERSKELLEEGFSPAQVAVESGFYDQSHLNRVFKEHLDMTPKEYQEKNFRNRN